MDNQQQQMPIDLANTEPVFAEDGSILFQPGILMRKISKFITGTPEDQLLPLQVFFEAKSGKILQESVPPELREEYMEHFKQLEEQQDDEN